VTGIAQASDAPPRADLLHTHAMLRWAGSIARLARVATLVLASACGDERPPTATPSVHVAAASSLTAAFEEIGRAFHARTGTSVRFVFGASGSLAQQLDAGAPFDVFAAADEASVARAVECGACDAATAGEYARGRLVVWTREGVAPPRSLGELADPRFARLALASPEHAPYGSAAREALRRTGLWSTVEPRVVYAENIRQALQFAETGNVDAAFVARSLVIDDARPHLLVDESMHAPIVQSLVVCRRGARREDGRAFADFVRSAEGAAILRRFGFAPTSGSESAEAETGTETETETETETRDRDRDRDGEGDGPRHRDARGAAMSSEPLALSFQIALVATLVAGTLGVALAGLMARVRFVGRDLLDALLTAPMVLPPTVLGYYLLVAIGREGAIGRAYESITGAPLAFTRTAAVIAACLTALPFVVKSARAAMEDVDPRLPAAAATLGASPLRVFFTIVLPLSRNGVLAGLTLGFARALGDFGVTLMVAGNIPGLTRTGALAIYDAVQAGRDSEAAGLAATMTALGVAALYLGTKLARRRPHAW